MLAYLYHCLKQFLAVVPVIERPLLELFLHCGLYVFTILDDSEVYEKQYPFTLVQLKDIALFCNQLGFLMLWTANAARSNEGLKLLCTRLLGVLFERDSRRAFVAPEDWFIADRRLAKEFDKEVMEESDRALNVRAASTSKIHIKQICSVSTVWSSVSHANRVYSINAHAVIIIDSCHDNYAGHEGYATCAAVRAPRGAIPTVG